MRGALSAKFPDSSVGGVPVGYCPDDGHMEEEFQLKVQVEEEEGGEKHGKEQGEEQKERERTNDQVAHIGDHADDMTRTNTFLSLAV